uniref:Uncharacterized protein n=1 Tax=Solanum tuberosum TaxID=4113 RepID=M1C8L9_SOLTU
MEENLTISLSPHIRIEQRPIISLPSPLRILASSTDTGCWPPHASETGLKFYISN